MANVDVTRIASNIGALNALNSLQNINKQLAVHQTRLSTGKRINSAADDPAGLTIATKMLARSEGLKVALANIGDANNMLSVAEAGMSKMNDIMITMRSKAQQAASDTLGSSERAAIRTQLESYAEQLDAIVAETKWNGVQLLDGTVNKRFQTGVDDGEYTNWQMSQKFTASEESGGLGVSRDWLTAGIDTNSIVTSSASGVTTPATTGALFTGLTALDSGDYTFTVMDKGGGTVGKTNVVQSSTSGVSVVSSALPGLNESASGNFTVEIVSNVAGTGGGLRDITYKIRDNSTGTWGANILLDEATGANTSVDLVHATGGTNLGFSMTATAGLNSLTTGDQVTFEYIKKTDVKVQVTDGSGQIVKIDSNDTNDTTNRLADFAYAANSQVLDTGRGLSVALAAVGSTASGDSVSFNYHQAGTNQIDVSSAIRASAYMATVENALNTVNSNMASLGSLMARLTFKEDQVATAQVNVESAYSRIMNANMAEEQVNASKFAILQQTATAMLAQANQAPQSLLSLFR